MANEKIDKEINFFFHEILRVFSHSLMMPWFGESSKLGKNIIQWPKASLELFAL